MKIIILEDDPPSLSVLLLNLKKKGHTCKGFSNPELALIAVQEEEFELLVLDFMLPGMDGLQFLQKLQDLGIDIPTIITTAEADTRVAKSFFAFPNVIDYALKPIRADFACIVCKYQNKVEKQKLMDEIARLKIKVMND